MVYSKPFEHLNPTRSSNELRLHHGTDPLRCEVVDAIKARSGEAQQGAGEEEEPFQRTCWLIHGFPGKLAEETMVLPHNI